jgi:hypothetical protein
MSCTVFNLLMNCLTVLCKQNISKEAAMKCELGGRREGAIFLHPKVLILFEA